MIAELMSGLDRVMGRRKQDRLQPYDAAVSDVVAEKTIDPEALAEVIESAGRTRDEFLNDVESKQQRESDKAAVAVGRKAEGDLEKLNSEVAAENARHEGVINPEIARHNAAVRVFDARRSQAVRSIGIAKEAQQSLIRSSPVYPAYTASQRHLNALRQELQTRERDRDNRAANLASTRGKLTADAIHRIESGLALTASEIAPLQTRVDAADVELKRLEARLLD